MSKTQITLIVITILLLLVGLWPIALTTTVAIIAIAIHDHERKRIAEKEELQQLKKRIEAQEREAYIDSLVNKGKKTE